MFCTGAAPTRAGDQRQVLEPRQPCSSVQATKSCQFSPAPASTIQASARSSTSRHAAHLDLEHDLRHVARQDDVAAAAEDELRRAAELRVVDHPAHVGVARDAHQRAAPRAGRPKVL